MTELSGVVTHSLLRFPAFFAGRVPGYADTILNYRLELGMVSHGQVPRRGNHVPGQAALRRIAHAAHEASPMAPSTRLDGSGTTVKPVSSPARLKLPVP